MDKQEEKREKCPYCKEEILEEAKVCKNCWLDRNRFDEYNRCIKNYKDKSVDDQILQDLCKIYRTLRRKKHISRKIESLNDLPAYYDVSIKKHEKLYKIMIKCGIRANLNEVIIFLAEYYNKKGIYEKNMLPVLLDYIDINYSDIFNNKG